MIGFYWVVQGSRVEEAFDQGSRRSLMRFWRGSIRGLAVSVVFLLFRKTERSPSSTHSTSVIWFPVGDIFKIIIF